MSNHLKRFLELIRRSGAVVLGVVMLIIGIAMIVLPGPAIIVIPLGLTILGSEFVWARRLLDRLRPFMARLLRKP